MKALHWTLYLDTIAAEGQEAKGAAARLRQFADYLERVPPEMFAKMDDGGETGGITGEPRIFETPDEEREIAPLLREGPSAMWKAVWKVEERD